MMAVMLKPGVEPLSALLIVVGLWVNSSEPAETVPPPEAIRPAVASVYVNMVGVSTAVTVYVPL